MTLIFFWGGAGVKRWDGKLCVPTEKSWLRPCYDEILLSDQPLPGVQNAKTNDIKIRRKLLNCVMESSTFFDQSWAAIITILSLLFSNLVLYKVTRHDRLTRKVPIVTKIKFLLTISIHCQEKIWELIKWSLKRNYLDLSSNSLN